MNHLEAAYYGKNKVWRYLFLLIAIFAVAQTIGSLPLLLKIISVSRNDPSAAARYAAEPNDPTNLGVDPNAALAMMLLPFVMELIAFILMIKPVNFRTFSMTVNGTGSIRWGRYLSGALVWLVISFVYLLFYLKISPGNLTINNISGSLTGLFIVSLIMIPLQAGLEEVVFRGYLMQGFSLLFRKRWFPLLVTSIIFGMLHYFNPEVKEYGFFTMMPQYFFFGLVFGIATIMDDGIEVAAGAHAANNFFISIMITSESSALQTAAVFRQITIHPWSDFISLVVMSLVFILIMKKLLGWGSFSLLGADIKKPGQTSPPLSSSCDGKVPVIRDYDGF
jgi:membrane protease YdiL (CAAX protease family)